MRSLLVTAMLVGVVGLSARQGWVEQVTIDGDPVLRGLPQDAIPAIDRPAFVAADRAEFVAPHEPVIGVVIDGEPRAYPTWLLNHHEIVNDRIGATAFAVTWCPLCYTAIVYDRTVAGRELSFGVSGMLWRENLVMYDRQTGSWWSQANGTAIRGDRRGTQLTPLPSDMMPWSAWRALHPTTVVLSTGRTVGRDAYATYHTGRAIGVTGRLRSRGALDAKARVAGFQHGGRAFAVPLDALKAEPVLQTNAAGTAVIVAADPSRTTARTFLAGGHRFTVSSKGARVVLRDRATGSQWDAFDGRATSGRLAGTRLERVPTHLSYWFAWHAFFPDSTVLGAR